MQEVVGYIRVSTPKQAEEGLSLEEQAHMLRGFCRERKLNLLSIQEDNVSAAGAQDHLLRDGFVEAARIAKERNVAILAPSVDRLARHPNILADILDSGLKIISVADGRRLGRKTLKLLIDRAQRERNDISQRVRKGMARAKKRGAKLGNTTNLDVAQRQGAISNVVRADRKIQELADFISDVPGFEKMTLPDKVDLLNRDGPLNLVSEKRRERRPWTLSSIRKPLKKAESELELRRELDQDDMLCSENWAWGADARNGTSTLAEEIHDEEDLPVEVAYQDNPDFGRF